jgi:hypothetical protein
MNKLYLLDLRGHNDTQISLVSKEVFDWIVGPQPNFGKESGIEDTLCPADIRKKLEEIHSKNILDEPFELIVTIGSCNNDRALRASYDLAETINGEEAIFNTTQELMNFCKKYDIEIEDSFQGYVY